MSLWPHQQKAVEMARTRNNFALLFDMGTGKTRTMIEILREDFNAHKKIRKTLIFAPLSICQQWKAEFAKYSKITPDLIYVLTQSGRKREDSLRKLTQLGGRAIVVTNYEAVGIKGFYSALLDWCPEIIIADEGHRLKNSGSERAKRIYPLALTAERRFVLTGTLFTNSMLDIFGPFKFLEPSIFGPSYWKFRNSFFYDKNARMPAHVHFPDWQPMPNAKDRISGIIADSSVQAKKSECLSLPPLLREIVPLTIQGAQLKAYQAMEKEYVAELKGKTVISEFAMSVGLRLRQILAGFLSAKAGDKPEYFDENPRIQAVSDLLDGIGKEKCIIWCNFEPTYKQLGDLLTKLDIPHVFLTGQQTAVQKQAALESFQGDGAQVLVSNPSAGGVGLNLAQAPYAIYFDKSYNLEHYLQSSARNHRAGSEQFSSVTQFSLQAQGTIDEAIEIALSGKEELGKVILDWAREKALAIGKQATYGEFQGEQPRG
jgi:SNF2 family DNA or RNA helicase